MATKYAAERARRNLNPHAEARDVQFARIVAWLQKHGLEMYTPMRGETYVCKWRPRSPRRIDIKERN